MSNTESWDGLLKNYLKAEHLEVGKESFACINVVVENDVLELTLEQRDKPKAYFTMNVTNMVFLKNNGITAPKEIVGKVLTFEKVKAFNPNLKKEVDALRINKVE